MRVQLLVIGSLLLIFSSCKKTYEEGPAISFRSKFKRITGTWKLVSMEGIDRIQPEKDQFMELTSELVSSAEIYRAEFTNFQDDYCVNGGTETGEALFTASGTWRWSTSSSFSCGPEMDFKEHEAIFVHIEVPIDTFDTADIWHIKRLKNKELIIENNECPGSSCELYQVGRRLTFEKVD